MKKSFGRRVMDRREEMRITRRQLAERLGIAYSTLAGIEGGKQFSSTLIDKLAGELKTTPTYLRDGGDPTLPAQSGNWSLSAIETVMLEKFRQLNAGQRRELDMFFLGALGSSPPASSSGKIARRQEAPMQEAKETRNRRSG